MRPSEERPSSSLGCHLRRLPLASGRRAQLPPITSHCRPLLSFYTFSTPFLPLPGPLLLPSLSSLPAGTQPSRHGSIASRPPPSSLPSPSLSAFLFLLIFSCLSPPSSLSLFPLGEVDGQSLCNERWWSACLLTRRGGSSSAPCQLC